MLHLLDESGVLDLVGGNELGGCAGKRREGKQHREVEAACVPLLQKRRVGCSVQNHTLLACGGWFRYASVKSNERKGCRTTKSNEK